MSDCQDRSREMLPEYAHGLLGPKEAKKVEDHLNDCLECALELRVLGRLEEEVLPEPGPWFFSSLPGKVTAEAEDRRRGKTRILIPVWAGGLAAAAIAVMLLLQPGSAPPVEIDFPDYSLVETAQTLPLGIEEELLSISGQFLEELDRTLVLDIEAVSEEMLVTRDLVIEGDGYETMDKETIRIFEDLVEEMTPERGRKRVMS